MLPTNHRTCTSRSFCVLIVLTNMDRFLVVFTVTAAVSTIVSLVPHPRPLDLESVYACLSPAHHLDRHHHHHQQKNAGIVNAC